MKKVKTENSKEISSKQKQSQRQQEYKKEDPLEHMLLRPDMYIGSTELEKKEEYVAVLKENLSSYSIQKRLVNISPAIVRIFIEPLSNAIDNLARSIEKQTKMTTIKININKETGETSFWNDGYAIPVEIHEKENCYVHTLIFGSLLTSSNFDDNKDRINISGKNGVGVKSLNVFSKVFTVEGYDPINKKYFSQTWRNNMKTVEKPVVKMVAGAKAKTGYTKVSYIPDFSRFTSEGEFKNGYTQDIIDVYTKLVIDTAMLTKLNVYLNDKLIPVKSLPDYARLFKSIDAETENKNEDEESDDNESEDNEENDNEGDNESEDNLEEKLISRRESQSSKTSKISKTSSKNSKEELLYIKTSDCEVALMPAKEFEAISFANGIHTSLGGVHVDAWSEALFRPIVEKFNKKNKPSLNISDVKKNFRLFVVAVVNKPVFDSQSKLTLKGPSVIAEVKKTVFTELYKWSVIKRLDELIRLKEMSVLKKATKRSRDYEKVEGLLPANLEGTKRSHECTLLLVEGLSASTYASNGIEKGVFGKVGPDYFGVLCLRGKVLNTTNAKIVTISKNKVVSDIIKALGVQFEVDYTIEENYKKLRYGSLMIISDQDCDGFHITGLIQNLFHSLFPSLLKRSPPFIISMQTPLIRVYKPDNRLFYNEEEFKSYIDSLNGKPCDKKYLKGLGSSTTEDIIETFGEKMVKFVYDKKCDDTMTKAFNAKHADARKKWLETYNAKDGAYKWKTSEQETINVSYTDFIDKEFIRFSIEDCNRSLPHLLDGMKQCNRKVLFTCFKRKLNTKSKEIKISQLSGATSELTAYKHGEASLEATIIGMCQSYVGSNNIPLLARGGIVGSRMEGGKDSASGRYVHTYLDMLTRYIFKEEDDVLLNYLQDDGENIEPEFYVPIIPMILVNGSIGIGTGHSTNIPCYNPIDLVSCIKLWLDKKEIPNIVPWYRKHTGKMIKESEDKFTSWGTVERITDNKVAIKELPIGYWTVDFIDSLKDLKKEKKIKDFIRKSANPVVIHIEVKEVEGGIVCDEKTLKLTSVLRTTNLVAFNRKSVIKKYKTVLEMIEEFCEVRYEYYVKRKKWQLEGLKLKIKLLENKKRFLEEIRDGIIVLFVDNAKKKESKKTSVLVEELTNRKYDKNIEEGGKKEKEESDEEGDEKDEKSFKGKHGFEYLLNLKISNITAEKINKLKNEIKSSIESKDELEKTSEKQIWLSELKDFEDQYKKYLVLLDKEDNALKLLKKKK
jgi:DNA topoisomerase II